MQERRKALHDTNVFLMALSLLICVFATYLVRSGVVQSLHAFGGSGVEVPLLIFMLVITSYSIHYTKLYEMKSSGAGDV